MVDCLLNLTGVTDSTTIPFYEDLDDAQQIAIAVSASGLYLDTLTGGIDLMGVDDVLYQKAVLDLGLKACNESLKVLNDELLLAINNRFHPAKTKFNGFIGRRSVSSTLQSGPNYQGQRYRMEEPIAGIITIKSIGVNVNGAASFNIYVARCNSRDPTIEEVLYTFPVTTVANVFTNADMSAQPKGIVLDMQIEGVPQEYYIYWKRDEAGGLYPKNNDLRCNTCSNNQAASALSGFMDFHGIFFSDPNQLHSVNADKYGHGLSVAAIVSCDHTTVICREYNKKAAVQLMIDKAAQYKAGELWIEYILKSAWVNRDNLQSREYMWGKRNNFRAEFETRITAIANEMELGETHCYVCRNDTMYKGTIYS